MVLLYGFSNNGPQKKAFSMFHGYGLQLGLHIVTIRYSLEFLTASSLYLCYS